MKKYVSLKERVDQLDVCVTMDDVKIVIQLMKDEIADAERKDDEARTHYIQQILKDDNN